MSCFLIGIDFIFECNSRLFHALTTPHYWENDGSSQDQSQSDVGLLSTPNFKGKYYCFDTSSKYNHDTLAVQLVLKTNYVLQFDIDLITDEDIMLNPKVTLCAHVLSYHSDSA